MHYGAHHADSRKVGAPPGWHTSRRGHSQDGHAAQPAEPAPAPAVLPPHLAQPETAHRHLIRVGKADLELHACKQGSRGRCGRVWKGCGGWGLAGRNISAGVLNPWCVFGVAWHTKVPLPCCCSHKGSIGKHPAPLFPSWASNGAGGETAHGAMRPYQLPDILPKPSIA